MKNKELIELLEQIVAKKMLDEILVDSARMCINILTDKEEENILTDKEKENIKNVRNMAIILIKKAGLIKISNTPNSFDIDDVEWLAKIPEIVKEIKNYLNTKDLSPDLATCLEFVIEDLTSEVISNEQKLEVIRKYYGKYRPAITIVDEYIPKAPNQGK